MAVLIIIMILTALIVALKYYQKWTSVNDNFNQLNLPGPEPLPLFGNSIPLLKNYTSPMQQYLNWAYKYGPLFKIRIGTQIAIVANDIDSVNLILKRHGHAFNQRPRGTVLSVILGNKGIVTSDGPVWKDHRVFLVRKFQDLKLQGAEAQEEIFAEAIQVVKALERKIDSYPSHAIDPTEIIGVSLFNLMWRAFGNRVKSSFDSESILKFLEEFPRQMRVAEIGGAWNYSVCTQLAWIVWNNPWKLLMGQLRQKAAIRQEVETAKKQVQGGYETENEWQGHNLLSQYLLEMKKHNGKFTSFSETQLETLLSDIIAAGVDTAHNGLRWALIFLAKNDTCQAKAREEIKQALQLKTLEEVASYTNRWELPYLCGVILETLRIRPIIHTFCHTTNEEVVLNQEPGNLERSVHNQTSAKVHVPAGTWAIINLWGVHHNEKMWPEPTEFRPERFLTSDGKIDKDVSNRCIPFSVGIRNCPGELFARTEMFTILVVILSKFTINVHPNYVNVTLDPITGVSLTAPRIGLQFHNNSIL